MGYNGQGPQMVEDEMMAVIRRTEWRRKVGMILLALSAVAGAGGMTYFIPGDPGDAGPVRVMVFAAAAVLLLAAGLALLLTSRLPPEARTGRLAMMRAEALQARRQMAFLLMPLSLIFMLSGVERATSNAMKGLPLRHVEIFSIACFCFFVVVFALLLAGRGLDRWARPVLDDEVSRAFRGRALQFGYLILLPGVVALFVVSLARRDLAIELTPVLAVLGVGAPAVRLFVLERSAGAGDAEA